MKCRDLQPGQLIRILNVTVSVPGWRPGNEQKVFIRTTIGVFMMGPNHEIEVVVPDTDEPEHNPQ